ncbi:HIT family protein [Candidatus Saccharibacteria bacterium]|nr:HIT family protein [Candidatus Saccharibacteria bacterium]
MTENSLSIFSRVRLGEIPGEIVYRDNDIFIMMTIAPNNPGHMLVIPVLEIANLEELPEAIYSKMLLISRQCMIAVKKIYSSPKAALVVVGFQVPHAHIHIFPLYSELEINPAHAKPTELSLIKQEADKIRAYFSEHPIQ